MHNTLLILYKFEYISYSPIYIYMVHRSINRNTDNIYIKIVMI